MQYLLPRQAELRLDKDAGGQSSGMRQFFTQVVAEERSHLISKSTIFWTEIEIHFLPPSLHDAGVTHHQRGTLAGQSAVRQPAQFDRVEIFDGFN